MTDEKDRTKVLDDQPLTDQTYRIGDVFTVYSDGASVDYKVTEIVERDGRRITYGEPVA